MDAMIKSRNLTSHTYVESTADDIIKLIKYIYFEEFEELKIKMNHFKKDASMQELNKKYLDLDELYLPYSFDISNIRDKDLVDHINRIGIIIYEKHTSY